MDGRIPRTLSANRMSVYSCIFAICRGEGTPDGRETGRVTRSSIWKGSPMSMPHPLDGARLKVVRAQKHLDSLKAEIQQYLSTDPYHFPAEINGNAIYARPAEILVPPPLELGCIFGDCLVNLRTSLDYIAWQLAVKFASAPPVVGVDKIYFPLAKGNVFQSRGLANYSIPDSVLDEIEKVQPYQIGYESLKLLSRLGNTDKHCLPLLTLAHTVNTSIDITTVSGPPVGECVITPPGSEMEIKGRHIKKMSVQRINDGSGRKLYRIDFEARLGPNAGGNNVVAQTESQVQVDGQVAVFVSLQDSTVPIEPVDRTLEQIVKCVADIVSRFESFF